MRVTISTTKIYGKTSIEYLWPSLLYQKPSNKHGIHGLTTVPSKKVLVSLILSTMKAYIFKISDPEWIPLFNCYMFCSCLNAICLFWCYFDFKSDTTLHWKRKISLKSFYEVCKDENLSSIFILRSTLKYCKYFHPVSLVLSNVKEDKFQGMTTSLEWNYNFLAKLFVLY